MTQPKTVRGWECGCAHDQKHTACPIHARSDVYVLSSPMTNPTEQAGEQCTCEDSSLAASYQPCPTASHNAETSR